MTSLDAYEKNGLLPSNSNRYQIHTSAPTYIPVRWLTNFSFNLLDRISKTWLKIFFLYYV